MTPNGSPIFGKGKIESILLQAQELDCNIILFNNELTPGHVKNLQKLAGEEIKILDRTGIIIDISDIGLS